MYVIMAVGYEQRAGKRTFLKVDYSSGYGEIVKTVKTDGNRGREPIGNFIEWNPTKISIVPFTFTSKQTGKEQTGEKFVLVIMDGEEIYNVDITSQGVYRSLLNSLASCLGEEAIVRILKAAGIVAPEFTTSVAGKQNEEINTLKLSVFITKKWRNSGSVHVNGKNEFEESRKWLLPFEVTKQLTSVVKVNGKDITDFTKLDEFYREQLLPAVQWLFINSTDDDNEKTVDELTNVPEKIVEQTKPDSIKAKLTTKNKKDDDDLPF